MALAECGTWVATVDGNVAGFVSAFVTPGRQGERRWEFDLVAVRRDDQGKGLGKRLLRQASEKGRSRSLETSRAFVRTENVQSQRIFEAVGYKSDRRVHLLHLWEPESSGGSGRSQPDEVKLIPVDTLTYRGLWIEGLSTVPEDSQETALKIAWNRVHFSEAAHLSIWKSCITGPVLHCCMSRSGAIPKHAFCAEILWRCGRYEFLPENLWKSEAKRIVSGGGIRRCYLSI